METIQEYFQRQSTLAAGSPVGALMVKIVEKNPGVSLEEARTEANALLDKAAKGKVYRFPRVYSPEEMAKRSESLRKAFRPLAEAA